MKLYVYDQGWAGLIMVVSSDPDVALSKIQSSYACRESDVTMAAITVHEITDGLMIESLGDQ